MRCFLSVLAFLTLSGLLRAHTGGEIEMKCPLDGTTFKAWQDFSGTSFGNRLDLKTLGPTASPWSLAQCPKAVVINKGSKLRFRSRLDHIIPFPMKRVTLQVYSLHLLVGNFSPGRIFSAV